jgi:NAD(P)-dependent dehydrogenase (short-subunit alcohol dehydrogenase family)
VPAGRAGRREEIARSVLFLASGKAELLTGLIIGIKGGKSAR